MRLRLLITLVLLIFVMIFAVQNAEVVEIRLLFWDVSFPRSLLIFLMLLIGITIGWFSRAMYRLSRNKD